jgi:AcrR family transcriptional regulator
VVVLNRAVEEEVSIEWPGFALPVVAGEAACLNQSWRADFHPAHVGVAAQLGVVAERGAATPSFTPDPSSSGSAPAAPTVGRLERRRQQTRQRLFTAAQELFATRGFDATTYDEIAERADVARQTAFNHFPRKEDFITAWIEQRREHLRQLLAETTFRQASADEQLTAYLRALATFNEDDHRRSRALTVIFSARLGAMFRQTAPEVFAESIRLGQRHGDLNPSVDPDLAAEIIFDSYVCTLYRWLSQDASFSLRDTLLAKLAAILDGIGIPRH